jgi:DNA anti-recombination protein RmuC
MKAQAIITWEEHQKLQREVDELRQTVRLLQENLDKVHKDIDQQLKSVEGVSR